MKKPTKSPRQTGSPASRDRVNGRSPRLDLADLRARILDWFRKTRRDLPWRRTTDPYAILVSETMLQQTRVDVVVPYFERWMERFPDATSLAAASEEDVVAAFSGLGYYRRARNLKRAAEAIVEFHLGEVPSSLDELRKLPGIGDYTAGAVASIAFGVAAPAVDGNVRRVASRILRLESDPATAVGGKAVHDLVSGLLVDARPADLNQGLMELGATVCTPRRPRCSDCPIRLRCAAFEVGDVERFPVKRSARRSRVKVTALVAVVESRSGILLILRRKGTCGGVLEDMWEAPFVFEDDASGSVVGGMVRLSQLVEEATGARFEPAGILGRARHAITFRDIEIVAVGGRLAGRPLAGRRGLAWEWRHPSSLNSQSPTSSLTKKAVRFSGRAQREALRALPGGKEGASQPSSG